MSAPEGWERIGFQVLYLDADDRIPCGPNEIPQIGRREPPHGGRGVMTYYGDDGKESWAPPADDLRIIWDEEYKVWGLYVLDRDQEVENTLPEQVALPPQGVLDGATQTEHRVPEKLGGS